MLAGVKCLLSSESQQLPLDQRAVDVLDGGDKTRFSLQAGVTEMGGPWHPLLPLSMAAPLQHSNSVINNIFSEGSSPFALN